MSLAKSHWVIKCPLGTGYGSWVWFWESSKEGGHQGLQEWRVHHRAIIWPSHCGNCHPQVWDALQTPLRASLAQGPLKQDDLTSHLLLGFPDGHLGGFCSCCPGLSQPVSWWPLCLVPVCVAVARGAHGSHAVPGAASLREEMHHFRHFEVLLCFNYTM